VPVELYDCDGSVGAAIGAGLGAGVYANEKEAFVNSKRLQLIEPKAIARYDDIYHRWQELLRLQIEKSNQ
jgi:xylulokinase